MIDDKLPDMSERLGLGFNFEGAILEAGAHIRAQSKVAYGSDLLAARLCLVSSLASITTIKAGVPGATNMSISDRLVLIMSFAQGFPITETLISEGQYIKAAAVLKQDYETVARLQRCALARPSRESSPT